MALDQEGSSTGVAMIPCAVLRICERLTLLLHLEEDRLLHRGAHFALQKTSVCAMRASPLVISQSHCLLTRLQPDGSVSRAIWLVRLLHSSRVHYAICDVLTSTVSFQRTIRCSFRQYIQVLTTNLHVHLLLADFLCSSQHSHIGLLI